MVRGFGVTLKTGQLEPHAKNLHLLERYVKLLDDHLMKRKTIKKS
jgi:hypothetical protein